MIKLILYGVGFYWLFGKLNINPAAKPLKGYGEAHGPFEHPLGDETCDECQQHQR